LALAFEGLLEALSRNDPDGSEAWLARLRQGLDARRWSDLEARLVEFDFRGAAALAGALMRDLKIKPAGEPPCDA
jgi:hypothetical protein